MAMEALDDSKEISISKSNGLANVKVNRPEKYNALNSGLLDELYLLFSELDQDSEVRVIVLSGTGGKAFIAGADLEEVSNKSDPFDFREYYLKFVKLADKIMNLSKPVVAAVQGYAFGGGCLLALSCDLVVATKNSKFGQQEINYGFMGGAGLLPKLIGKHRAAEIVMLGNTFDAAEAYRIGVVNKLVAEDELENEVQHFCANLMKKSPQALQMIKSSIRVSLEAGTGVANLYESEVASLCLSTASSHEAIATFLNKK